MRVKPVYKLRISTLERTFTIYKLSNYTMFSINAIHMGLVYDKSNSNYSKTLLKYCKKYNLDPTEASLTDDFRDFCSSLYVDEQLKNKKNQSSDVPNKALEYCKTFFNKKLNDKIKELDYNI